MTMPFPWQNVETQNTDQRVYRARALPILQRFELDGLKKLHDASAFAFATHNLDTFVFICRRPDLWQVSAIEDTYRVVSLICQNSQEGNT